MKITTDNFRVPLKKVLFYLVLLYGKVWIIISVIGLFLSLLLGMIVEPKWFVVMFIWVCIVLPMLLIFLYFYHGLLPLNAINISPHHITINDDEIIITSIKEEEDKVIEKYEIKISNSSLEKIITDQDAVILVSNLPKGILVVNYEALVNKGKIIDLITFLNSKVQQSNNVELYAGK